MTSSYTRADKRAPTDMRPLEVELGVLPLMDGSATFGFGRDQVLATFTGPSETNLRDEFVDKATLKISHRPLEGIGATPSKALSSAISPIYESLLSLHAYPRTQCQLTLQTLTPSTSASSSSSSSLPISFSQRAAAVNASTLAILDAGSIGLRATPIAAAVAVVSRKGKERAYYPYQDDSSTGTKAAQATADAENSLHFILDPTADEEKIAVSKFVVGWAFGAGMASSSSQTDEDTQGALDSECVYFESEGAFDFVTVQKAHAATRQACFMILSDLRKALLDRELKDSNVHGIS